MPAMLGPIIGATITTPDLAATEAAYSKYLGYEVAGRTNVSTAHASLWGAPATAGSAMLLMKPSAGDDFLLRFIETPSAAGYRAFTGHGWNAVELIVADVDRMSERFDGAGFEVVSPPMDLSFCTDIRAMQIRGPAGEIIYLTQFKKAVPGLDAPPARCDVDRAFIVIVCGPSLPGLQDFYSGEFSVPVTPAVESRVQAMALAFGLTREHRFRLAALPLRGRCYIEADEMPPQGQALPAEASALPAGVAMVSFRGDPGPGGVPPPAADRTYASAGTVACRRGAAGELLEIVGPGY